MATYSGTNNNDSFFANSSADVFNMTTNVLGQDTIDGGGGVDTLNLSYATLTGYGYSSSITANDTGWNGSLSGDGTNYLSFSNIEKLNVTLTAGDDYLYVDSAPLATAGNSLTLKGGAGADYLQINFSTLTGTTFTVGAGGAVTSNRGTFSQWETYSIALGAGTNNVTTAAGNDTVTAGTGNDTISTGAGGDTINGGQGGADTIDGGADYDSYFGDYSTSVSNLTFTYNSSTGAGSMTGGTTLANIEYVGVTTGSGNDSFVMSGNGNASTVNGGDGVDTLTLDRSGTNENYSYSSAIFANGAGGFSGYTNGGITSFSNVEKLNFTLSDDDNYLAVDAAPLAIAGNSLTLSGGAGTDFLQIDFSALASTTFTVGAGGSVTSNRGSFSQWEAYGITLGAGANSVTTGDGNDTVTGGAGDDTISTGAGNDTAIAGGGTNLISTGAGNDTINGGQGGVDTIDGGADYDTYSGDYSTSVSNLTFTYDGTGGAGSLTGGTTLANVEAANLTTGSGNDSFVITGATYSGSLNGGDGVDTLTFDQSGVGSAYSYSSAIYANGPSGFSGYTNGGYSAFYNIEKLNLTLSDDDNYLSVDASPLAIEGNSLTLSGGAGTDHLQIDFSALSGTTFAVGAGGGVTSNRGTFSQWETYSLTLGAGTNSVTTGGGNDIVTGGTGNDTIITGAGNDTIYDSQSGANTIDGGADYDIYNGDYSASTSNLTFNYSGISGVGSLTGGTTLTGIEATNLATGSGNDSFVVTGSSYGGSLNGADGIDTLTLDQSGSTGDYYYSSAIYSNGAGSFSGYTYGGYAGFSNFEKISLTLSDDDNYLTVDAAPLATAGNSLTLNGGIGNDQLRIDLSTLSGTTFIANAGGSATTNIPNLTVSNFESYNFTLGNGANIVTTGAGDDSIAGGTGNDVIDGGLGQDALSGGTGTDTLSYATAGAGVAVNLALQDQYTDTIGAGNDYLSGFENLIGSAFNDTLTGDTGSNVIEGGAGNDVLNGAAGTDTASYASAGAGVTVSLATSAAQNTIGAGVDTLSNFERLTGSDFNDTLTGNTGANVLTGGSGNDVLDGGAGSDTLDGGAGSDIASYLTASAAVTVNLSLAAAQNTAGGGTDTLLSIEGVYGSAFNDTLSGSSGDNLMEGAGGDDSLSGGLGIDTASYSKAAAGVTVSLATASAQNTGGAGTDTLSGFENLAGSDFNDTLTGGAGNNVLDGGAGDDVLDGGLGDDRLVGGSGFDTATYAGAATAVTVSLINIAAQNTGGGGIDTLFGVNNLIGSNFNDTLAGDSGNNVLDGGIGNDLIDGGLGDDALIGGSGTDTATYANTASGVVVSLATATAQNTGSAGIDTLSGIENLNGSAFNDTLTGDSGNNVLDGGLGNDLLNGGLGDDSLIGGGGSDTATYASATAAVAVSLLNLAAQNTSAAGIDTLSGIENLTGSNFNDTLTGDSGNNIIDGGSGNDLLDGGLGDDTLTGGTGTDTATYASATGNVAVSLANLSAQNTGAGGTDTLLTIENVIGSAFNDTLTGSNSNNVLDGGIGNDVLNGGLGNDTLTGGTGIDTASYIDASAAVTVNLSLTTAQNTVAAGTDTLASIENLIGSGFSDTLTGSAGNNLIEGGIGDDIINGGAGTDTASYASAVSAVTVNLSLATAQNTGGAGTDTLTLMEGLIGSAFNDVLTGSSGNNTIEGGAGNDTIDGGSGTDTASYVNATAGVTVNLNTTTGQDTVGAGIDTIKNVESIIGSAFNDSFTGNSLDNIFTGGAGNDTINGGTGTDTASYATATTAVKINLNVTTAQNTLGAGSDTLILIENITGSAFNDTVTGNGSDNLVDGGAGNDVMDGGSGTDVLNYTGATSAVTLNLSLTTAQDTGGAGMDTIKNFESINGSTYNDILTGNAFNNVILGGGGNDTIDGDAGSDTASYAGAVSAVTVNLSLAGEQDTGGGGIDTLISMESLIGSSFNDTLTGTSANNSIEGGAGDDLLDGGAGSDVLTFNKATGSISVNLGLATAQNTGGAGVDTVLNFENVSGSKYNDVIIGTTGNNIINGGNGADTLTGGGGNDTFIYSFLTYSLASGADLITDLTAGDKLDFRSLDADSTVAGTQHLSKVEVFHGEAGQYTLAYNGGTNLSTFAADTNGDAVADMLINFTGNVTALDSGWLFV